MADSQINIFVRLKDEASQAMQQMGGKLEGALKNAQGASLAFTGAIGAVGYGLFSAARAAEEADKVHRQLEAVLRSTGGAAGWTKDQAVELASEMQRLTNFDDEAVISAQNLLLTFTKIGNETFPRATKAVLDMSTAFGQDTKASAIQLGKALNDPIQGVSALSRVGVQFTKEQEEMIANFVATNDIASAQAVILKELETQVGGSAEAMADPWIQMKNALSDAWETAGQQLKPVLDALAVTITNFATNTLPALIEKITAIVQWFKENEWAIYAVAGAITGAVVPAIWAMVSAFAAAAIALAPFIIGGAIIGGIVAGVSWIIENWEMLRERAAEIWNSIKEFLTNNIGNIVLLMTTGGIGLIAKYIIQNWDNIKAKTQEIWTGIGGIIAGVWEGIKETVKSGINWVIEKINNMIEKVNEVLSKSAGAVGIKKSPSLKTIPMLANGGIVTRPTLAMVGEGGEPEAVIPLSRLREMGGGGSGVVVNINGNVLTGPEYARELGRELALEIKRQVRL